MATVCRLCGNNEVHSVFIFGNEALKHHIALKIRFGLDILISHDDALPKHACACCLGKLDEFWTFQEHCKKVQTKLQRLLPEQVPFQLQNINCEQHQNFRTSTEGSSAHIQVLEILGDSTGSGVNNLGHINSNNNGKVKVNKVKVKTHSHENPFYSCNESLGNERELWRNGPCLNHTDKLVTTQNGSSLAAGELASYCEYKEENLVFSAAANTSESVPEDNSVTVEEENEVQDNLFSEKTDSTNTVLGHSGSTLYVNNINVNSRSFSDKSQDSVLMEEQTLEVPNIYPQSTNYKTTSCKSQHRNRNTDTCDFLSHISQSPLLMEEQSLKNGTDASDCKEDISPVLLNIVSNIRNEVDCQSVVNSFHHPMLKEEVATIPATDTCSESISDHEVWDGEETEGDANDSSQHSVIIPDLSLNHPNNIENYRTNVKVCENDASSGYIPRDILGKKCNNTISEFTGKVQKYTQHKYNVVSNSGDSRPLQALHYNAETAIFSDKNMDTSEKVNVVTSDNEMNQMLQLNTASRSNYNTGDVGNEHSMIFDSGNRSTCVHGIDANMCIYKRCCDSHPFDNNWNKVRSRFHCLLCKFVTKSATGIRKHISAHVSLKFFECSVCHKKLLSSSHLINHMKYHGRKDDSRSWVKPGVFFCEKCSKSFKRKSSLRNHLINVCQIGTVSCPDCGWRSLSIKKHLRFDCPGKTGFQCNVCNKSFNVKRNLRLHLQTHACVKCV